jgi:hypothetical protein
MIFKIFAKKLEKKLTILEINSGHNIDPILLKVVATRVDFVPSSSWVFHLEPI